MRVGVFGGAFNPPHVGHLVCAQEALLRLGLHEVLFVPVGEAPHREIEADPGAQARAEMCQLALAGDDRFRLSRIELEREGPSYTADTLRALREQAPEDELVLILGGDQALSLATGWREPEQVASLVATIGVAEREGLRREEIAARVGEVPGARGKLAFFDMPRVDVSSTLARRRAAAGEPLRYLVPDAVASYIAERELFTGSVPSPGGAR